MRKVIGLTLSSMLYALCSVGALLFAFCFSATAQPAKKVHRIGYLSPLDPARESVRSEPIRLALRELGYIEGNNLTIEYRYADGNLDRAPALAAELVRLKADIIVAPGTERMVLAAKSATSTIPIVMLGGTDPVKERLVESLARPGGNVTGITLLSRELGGKRLELLKEAVPKVGRLAVVYDPAARGSVVEIKDILPDAARALGMTVRSWEIQDPDAFEKLFAAVNKERPDALYVPIGPLVRIHAKRITSFALQNRLPSIYSRKEFPEAGGLMSYDADIADSYRRVAYYIDRILKGAKPAELPVEQPTKFELVINLKTAKHIGVTIPHWVLVKADRVIR
jgi:putative ABC transport system substrate-binding protein